MLAATARVEQIVEICDDGVSAVQGDGWVMANMSTGQGMVGVRSGGVNAAIGAFESETAAVLERTAPTNEHVVLWVLLIMLMVAFGLSAVVKVDRVVVGQGLVVPIGGELYVSPLDRAIVREVRVKSGDVVKKDQVLATLDPTFTAADLAHLEEKLSSDQALVDRLQSEYEGKPYKPATDSASDRLQLQIRQQRDAEYRSTLADYDGRIGNAESLLIAYRHDAESYGKRLQLAQEQENITGALAKKGYISHIDEMHATDQRVDIDRQAANSHNQVAAYGETVASLKGQRAAFTQKWQSDLRNELVTARNSLEETRSAFQKARKLDELSELQSPADAVVLKVSKVSTGAIASSTNDNNQSEPLFTLVPLDAPVEADLRVDARDVGFIRPGDHVELKLEAYRYLQHGTAKGVVKTVSEGSFSSDEATHQATNPFFKVRVSFTDVKLRNVPESFRLVPGMTLTGDILEGRRTILSYLVEGALRTGSEAMREP